MDEPLTGPAPGTAPMGLPRARYSLTLNSASIFIVGVVVQLIGFVGSLFLYKYVGVNPAGQALFGTVQFFFLIASLINGLGDLRLGTGYQFFLARGKPATSNTATYLVLRFVMVGIAGAFVLLLSNTSLGGGQLVSGPQQFLVLALFMLMPLLWTLETVYNTYYVGVGNSVRAQIPAFVEVCARTPVIIAVALLWPTLLGLTIAYLVGAIVGGLVCLPEIWPLLRRFRISEASFLFRYSWPFLGALVLSTIAINAIPFIVQASLGVQALNNFNAANSFRLLAIGLPLAICGPLFPYLAGLHKLERYDRIRQGTWNAIRYSMMLLIPGVVALVVYRVNLLNILFNGLYATAVAAPLAILVLSTVPASLAIIIGTGLAAIGWRKLELYLTALQVAALFIVAIALMPPYGILPGSDGLVSASIAVLVSGIAAFGLNAYFLRRLMAVHVFPKSVGTMAASAVASFLVIAQINNYLPINRYYQLAFGILVGFLVYFAALAVLGELSREDVRQIGGSMGLPTRWLELAARFCWRRVSPHQLRVVAIEEVPGLKMGYVEPEEGLGPLPPSDP